MNQREWTEADYDRMSWHDNHVYGLQIEAGEHGTGREAIITPQRCLEPGQRR
jgi:hypothetical protein